MSLTVRTKDKTSLPAHHKGQVHHNALKEVAITLDISLPGSLPRPSHSALSLSLQGFSRPFPYRPVSSWLSCLRTRSSSCLSCCHSTSGWQEAGKSSGEAVFHVSSLPGPFCHLRHVLYVSMDKYALHSLNTMILINLLQCPYLQKPEPYKWTLLLPCFWGSLMYCYFLWSPWILTKGWFFTKINPLNTVSYFLLWCLSYLLSFVLRFIVTLEPRIS